MLMASPMRLSKGKWMASLISKCPPQALRGNRKKYITRTKERRSPKAAPLFLVMPVSF
jgi:hypothetical protein